MMLVKSNSSALFKADRLIQSNSILTTYRNWFLGKN